MIRMSARSRIAMGQIALLTSVLMLAVAIGFVPSPRDAVLEGRARLCESIAISSSVMAARNDMAGMRAAMEATVKRDPKIVSAGVRDANNKLIAIVGDHVAAWKDSEKSAQGTCVYVPIVAGDKQWGSVEMVFQPIDRGGIIGMLERPSVRLVAFVAVASWILFHFYLKKTLKHLDPSKVVPGRVRNALDTLAEGLLVLDKSGQIMLANHAFAAIAGKQPDEMIGKKADSLPWVFEEGAAPIEYPWNRAIDSAAPLRNITLQLRDSTGSVRSFVVNCSPVQGHDGKYRGVLASFEDVTVLESQKTELAKSKEAADAANRAKSEFLARMSHEIRTPMNAILGFADVLRRGYEESEEERQEYLNTIHSSGQHLLQLINDILDLSKIESGKMQIEKGQCSPHLMISEVVTVLRVRAKEKNITLNYRWDGEIPETITTDPTRFRQVLTNLVGNSLKFTEKGGVTLVARMAGENKLAVDVIDTGIGIQKEAMDKLFQAFMQADTSITRRFGGTGLGLNISKQLTEAMGGQLSVASEYGKGSTFTITVDTGSLEEVPMLQVMPASSAALHESKDAGAVSLPGIRVLSCEDGPSNQKLITLVLRRAGAAVVDTAPNGQVGVELAMSRSYDVILMDMQMPVMDGYSATGKLRENGCTLPIIAMTAHAMKGEEQKCLDAGCTGYVPKPIEVNRLLQTVAKLTGIRGAEIQPPVRTGESQYAPTGPLKSTLPMDDPDFREVVLEFVDRLGDRLGEIQHAWEEKELTRVAQLAHWLKGSGGTAGFGAFTAPAKKLEQCAKAENLDDVAQAIEELRQLASRIDVGETPPTPTDNKLRMAQP